MANNKLDTNLDPNLIKHFMDKAGLKTKDMVSVLGNNDVTGSEWSNFSRRWSRIMKSGDTRPEDAKLIADALRVSISDLQHPNFNERKSKLIELIKSTVTKMNLANDEVGMTRVSNVLNFGLPGTGDGWDFADDSMYGKAAERANNIIERLHLLGEIEELELFANAFGVTTEDMHPATLKSYWLISSGNRYYYSLGKLVSGHTGVLAEIEKNWEAIPDVIRNDSSAIKVIVSKHGKKYRLHLESSRWKFEFSCVFYACDASVESGLPSINASKWEHEKLMTSLQTFLLDHADTVVIEDKQFPPENKITVFQVRFFDVSNSKEDVALGTRTFNNNLLFRGSLQTLLKKHSADDLDFLAPPLNGFGFPGIQIWLHKDKRPNKYYEISFGWLEDDGNFHEGHWPGISREQFIKSTQYSRELPILVLDENDVIPPFEPEPSIPVSDGGAV